jgi:hypothetical protein
LIYVNGFSLFFDRALALWRLLADGPAHGAYFVATCTQELQQAFFATYMTRANGAKERLRCFEQFE